MNGSDSSAAPASSRRPLVLRLAVPLALAVVLVLLVVGLVVNRVVSRGFEQTLTEQQQARLEVVADGLAPLVQLPSGRGVRPGIQATLRGIANQSSGHVVLLDVNGRVIAQAGRLPPGGRGERVEQPLVDGGEPVGTLVVELPAAPPGEGAFLRVFNLTLVITGVVAVVVLVGLSGLLADRLTRPLRAIAAAARRLESGDLTVRARGGADAESAELAEAFNSMAGRLERSEMLRRRAASDMAHDLATPATLLESQLQAMVDGVVPADREQLERARAAAGALSGVIVQLGELASAEAAPLHRQPVALAVVPGLREIEHALEALLRERAVQLNLDATPGADVTVTADPAHFGRALRNVISNAIQHSPPGGVVDIGVHRAGDRIEIRVTDAGPGIDVADLPHVFERFYRADRSRAQLGDRAGSGIGLTIARELLVANGGSVEVEHTGPAGTTFLLVLPAASPPPRTPGATIAA